MKPNGIIVYEGPSKFDGRPIVCIVTGTARGSQNEKTGKSLQSWIIRQDINPYSAWCDNKDISICGNCIHRQLKTCYVNKAKAVYQVFKAYKRGSYPKLDCYNIDLIKDKFIRFGSYGEITSLPIEILENLVNHVAGFTGYTHQYKKYPEYKDYCMASIENIEQKKMAESLGFRTFRVRIENEPVLKDEFICPASLEAGRKTNCNKCQACAGISSKIKKNVTIIVHGISRNKFVRIMTLKKNHKKFSHLI